MNLIKYEWNRLYRLYSTIDQIIEPADYHRVKRWTKKVRRLYTVFALIAVVFTFMNAASTTVLYALAGESTSFAFIPLCFLYLIMALLAIWGIATLILQFKQVVKDVGESASVGYQVGEQVQETHYEVTHEYGDQYRVTKHTENKGCLFGIIGGVLRFMVWAFFCIYVGTFLTFRKYRVQMSALQQYETAHR